MVSVSVPVHEDPRRAARLLKLFRDVTKSDRAITTQTDAGLFLEAIRSTPSQTACLESVTSREAGLKAVRSSVRITTNLSFLRENVLPFIAYLTDPELKVVYDGDLLRLVLAQIAEPPALWNQLLKACLDLQFNEEEVHTFSWLCCELAGTPGKGYTGITSDISSALEKKPLVDARDQRTRDIVYRIKKIIALKTSETPNQETEGPGGRHDNDFSNFRDVSIFPTSDEFYTSTSPFYQKSNQIAAIDFSRRPAAHLDNQFRLLREDMLGELREDLRLALGKKKDGRPARTLGGLNATGIYTGDEKRGKPCAILVSCRIGLEALEGKSQAGREKYLEAHPSYLRHQAFGALCSDNHIVAFAFLVREVEKLAQKPPVIALQLTNGDGFSRALSAFQSPQGLRFVLVNTPVFAYQPVLECLQDLTKMPLDRDLLHLRTDNDDGAESRYVTHSPSVEKCVEKLEKTMNEGSGRFALDGKLFRLDGSQMRSVVHALRKGVSLIQGPPGTGKSFVGALAAKTLLKDSSKRLLILSFTNHALDQFLEDLLNTGVDPECMTRLGFKFNEATEKLSLDQQFRGSNFHRSKDSWQRIDGLKCELRELRDQLEDASLALMRKRLHSIDILDRLEFSDNHQNFHEAFKLPEQESGYKIAGKNHKEMPPEFLYEQWSQGHSAEHLSHLIPQGTKYIWEMTQAQRDIYVQSWTQEARKEQIETAQNLAQRFDEAQGQMDTFFNESKCKFIQTKRVIGCTTTGAAKYTALIKAAKPDVVLVEEAGEILEAHVLTALHQTTSQLILIGDHKQLRPKINNYALSVEKGEGFDLNRSLFERLILQGHEHVTLQKQHRMHPDISALVRGMTYPELLDDPKTLTRAPPRGLIGRVSFVNHSHPETQDSKITDKGDAGFTGSKTNMFEAQMVLKLVRYMGQQGYKTRNIVVLTPYLGQLRLIKDLLSADMDPVLNDMDSAELIAAGLMTAAAGKVKQGTGQIKLSTIDNYQGEESDIVIASMTRSNKKGDIGFMKAPERLNVLCSRARECLIMIGDMETFMRSVPGKSVWLPFFSMLKSNEYLHDGVPVQCQQHPDRTALLRNPEDFDNKCPDGGCEEKCDAVLSCGKHRCQRRCHQIADHSSVTCQQRVKRTCDRDHTFKARCGQKVAVCPTCAEEDAATQRRLKSDLQLEKDRLKAQKRYAQELQEIEDELDHEQRLQRHAQKEDEEKQKLESRRADLEALRKTRSNTKRMEEEEKKRAVAQGTPSDETSKPDPQRPLPSGWGFSGGAREEWEKLKEVFGDRSQPLDNLMGMIGLESVKQEFLTIKSKVDTNVRQGVDLAKERFGCTLLGNPGTGKTTIARIYGKFLTSVGVIPGRNFEETSGSKLANLGVQGCQQMLDKVLGTGGGVIFIDEAYQLSSGNSPGGKAVLDFLLAEVENLTGKIVFVLAGYSKQMESFFAHNPGFPSRFPLEMKFEDYSDDELLQIMKYQIDLKYGGRMKWEDELYLRVSTRKLGRGRGTEGFGNARAVQNLLSIISSRQANRLRKLRIAGKPLNELLFTKEDLIGPEPANALPGCAGWKKLQSLIGLSSVRSSVQALVDTMQTNYRREIAEEAIIEYSLNKVFLGNPGTGKTTVAKLYGQILVDLGLLSNGEVIVKNPADFVGAVIGGSEAQTKAILASTVGKVLVIDEAYGLYGGGEQAMNQFKTAVIDTIVAEVQSVPGEDRCVLLLGYKDKMETMFQHVNPGLSRRFPMSSAFTFEDFDQHELREILELKLKQQAFKATDQAKNVALEMLDRARNRPNFGNAGEIDIILNDAKARHQKRLSTKKTIQLSTLEALDLDEDFERTEKAETNVAQLFQGTIGCELIQAKLEGFQRNAKASKELGMNPKENIPFNFLFRGPPGTGKTSTARKMGKVFYDMGFLATAEVVECSATDLIGQYVGQTGPKVQSLLDKALGRVLFVDEAYRLNGDRFAKEAVDELVDCVTKDRYKDKMIIILAGYDSDINRLLSVNPGLSSRFPDVIEFSRLDPGHCFDLLCGLLEKKKHKLEAKKASNRVDIDWLLQADSGLKETLIDKFKGLSGQAGWANARDVESLAKSMFMEGLDSRNGSQIAITQAIVEHQMETMLQERETRGKQTGARHNFPKAQDQSMPPQDPDLPKYDTGARQNTQAPRTSTKDNPPAKDARNGDAENSQEANPVNGQGIRDAGVSDEVWEQLGLDKKAKAENDERYQALLKANAKKDAADDAAKAKILKDLLEEEERREKEDAQCKKAKTMGRCPVGFEWFKQANGFRCAGGSHWISDEDLAGF